MEEEKTQTHAVVVSFPGQGHINAIISLSLTLASRGLFITILIIRSVYNRMFNNAQHAQNTSQILKTEYNLDIQFLAIDDPKNFPSTIQDIGLIFEVLESQHMVELMLNALKELNNNGPPIACIISDSFLAATDQVASSLNVPRVLFWPYCAAASVAQANAKLLLDMGIIPVRADDIKNPTKFITCLPGIPPLLPRDLRSCYREENSSNLMFQTQIYESEIQCKADWVLVNTFEELEGHESINGLSKSCPAKAIGPVFLENLLNETRLAAQNLISTSLWGEDDECMKWLDKHSPNSVLYISFGSTTTMSREQIQEVEIGLRNSDQPFLWVIRPGLILQGSYDDNDFNKKNLHGKGLLVSWVSQLKVLSHPSVGGFLTHNGWNSTIESISLGVPMIGWPFWSEQFLNCRFSQDVWRIGIDLQCKADNTGFVKSSDIEVAVRRLMQMPEGSELRENAAKLKEAAIRTVMPGGSSHRNMEEFVQYVNKLCRTK